MKNKVTLKFLKSRQGEGESGSAFKPQKLEASVRVRSLDKPVDRAPSKQLSFGVFGDVGLKKEKSKEEEELRPIEIKKEIKKTERPTESIDQLNENNFSLLIPERNETTPNPSDPKPKEANIEEVEQSTVSPMSHKEDLYMFRFDLAVDSLRCLLSSQKRFALHRLYFLNFLQKKCAYSLPTLRRCIPNPVYRQRLKIGQKVSFLTGLCEYIDNKLFKKRKLSVLTHLKSQFFLCLLKMKQSEWDSNLVPFIQKAAEEVLEEKKKEEERKTKLFRNMAMLNKKLVNSLASKSVKHMHIFFGIERNIMGLQRTFRSMRMKHLKHIFYLIEQMGMKKARVKKILKNCYSTGTSQWSKLKRTMFLRWKYPFMCNMNFLIIMEKKFPHAINSLIIRIKAKAFHSLDLFAIRKNLEKQIKKAFRFDPEKVKKKINKSLKKLIQNHAKKLKKAKAIGFLEIKGHSQCQRMKNAMKLLEALSKKAKNVKKEFFRAIQPETFSIPLSGGLVGPPPEPDVYTYLDIEEVRFVDERDLYFEEYIHNSNSRFEGDIYGGDYDESINDDYEFLTVTEIPPEYFA